MVFDGRLIQKHTMLLAFLAVLLATTHTPTTAMPSALPHGQVQQLRANMQMDALEASEPYAVQPAVVFSSAYATGGRKLMAPTLTISARLMYKGKNLFDRAEAAQVRNQQRMMLGQASMANMHSHAYMCSLACRGRASEHAA
jgi:hypothetical protein